MQHEERESLRWAPAQRMYDATVALPEGTEVRVCHDEVVEDLHDGEHPRLPLMVSAPDYTQAYALGCPRESQHPSLTLPQDQRCEICFSSLATGCWVGQLMRYDIQLVGPTLRVPPAKQLLQLRPLAWMCPTCLAWRDRRETKEMILRVHAEASVGPILLPKNVKSRADYEWLSCCGEHAMQGVYLRREEHRGEHTNRCKRHLDRTLKNRRWPLGPYEVVMGQALTGNGGQQGITLANATLWATFCGPGLCDECIRTDAGIDEQP